QGAARQVQHQVAEAQYQVRTLLARHLGWQPSICPGQEQPTIYCGAGEERVSQPTGPCQVRFEIWQ
ncbi:hypothetical protein H4S07_006649, partial [Coemansia furcata]